MPLKIITKNSPYYLITISIFILLKFIYTLSNTNYLIFILKPTSTLIELVTNSKGEFVTESGYLHKKLTILINKSCSGFNFWLLCFTMLAFLAFQFLERRIHKIVVLPILLFSTYVLTIGVNTSRILFSIFIDNTIKNMTGYTKTNWLHQAEGVFIYLSFLIIIYLCFNFILKKIRHFYATST